MFRIDHATAVGSLPTPTGAGTPGYYVNANPSGPNAGVGTYIDATWLNAVQEELLSVLTAAGVTPAKLDGGGALIVNHLVHAVRRLAGANITAVNANHTLLADEAGVVFVDATSGNVTLTLPLANVAGGAPIHFRVRRLDASANTVSVVPAGSDTFSPGSPSSVPITALRTTCFTADGTSAWWVVPEAGRLIGVRTFTSSGTYTPTPGLTFAIVDVAGGGGAGGGTQATSAGQAAAGGGGGASGYAKALLTASAIGSSQTVTIGAGGTPASGAIGGNGAATSLGSLISVPGGSGGDLGLANSSFVSSTAGGAAGSAPTITGTAIESVAGRAGGLGFCFNFSNAAGGVGGIGAMGGPGDGGLGGLAPQSTAATAGAAGIGGKIIIWEYA